MKIITGGQTGVDQAAWRAAKACGIKTGGWMPHAYMTEEGSRPDFAKLYNAWDIIELGPYKKRYILQRDQYRVRTRANVNWADATFWLTNMTKVGPGDLASPGFRATASAARDLRKPFITITGDNPEVEAALAIERWYHNDGFSGGEWIVNIAGNRESKAPGIGQWAEKFLCAVFHILGSA